MKNDRLMPAREVFEKLGRRRTAVKSLVAKGELAKPIREGNRLYWRESEIRRYLRKARERVEPGSGTFGGNRKSVAELSDAEIDAAW